MIRKILFDQRQERLGLPNSEQLLVQDSPLLKEANDIVQKGGGGDFGATAAAAAGEGGISMLGTDRASMPMLPPGVEFIDKSNFPPNK